MQSLDFTFPLNGMNSTLDPQGLPDTSGAYLENLTFDRARQGSLRYGTKVLSPVQNSDIALTSLTTTDRIAKAVTKTPHGLTGLSRVTILGSYPLEYNGTSKKIRYVDEKTFNYTVDQDLQPAKGSPRLRKDLKGTCQNLPEGSEILNFFEFEDRPLIAVKHPESYIVPKVENHGNTLVISDVVQSTVPFLISGNQIKILYTLGGVPHYCQAFVTDHTLEESTLTLTLNQTLNEAGVVQGLTYFVVKFYLFEEKTGHYTLVSGDKKFFGFSPFRSTTFRNHLIVVNGVDPVHTWEGQTFAELKFIEQIPPTVLSDYKVLSRDSFSASLVGEISPYRTDVIEVGFSYQNFPLKDCAINGNTVTLTCSLDHGLQVSDHVMLKETGFVEYDYKTFQVVKVTKRTFEIQVFGDPEPIPQNTGTFNLLTTQRQTKITQLKDRLVVTLSDKIFPETGHGFSLDQITIAFTTTTDALPAFRFITVAHDRLWALGEGVDWSVSPLKSPDALCVYYTQGQNTLTDWMHPQTRSLPFIDLSDKQNTPDQLEAIVQLSQGLVFLGRHKTQIWTGTDPTLNTGTLAFLWHKTLPVGCLHGNLVQSVGNDVWFMSGYGLLSLTSLSLIDEFETRDLVSREINHTLKQQIERFLENDLASLKARSFVYPQGQFVGFRLRDFPFVYEMAAYNKGWSLFTGDFRTASEICVAPRSHRLILSQNNRLYAYGDHVPYSFADQDGVVPISFKWVTPLVSFPQLWANQRLELQANATHPVEIALGLVLTQNQLAAPQLSLRLSPDVSSFDKAPWNTSFWSQETGGFQTLKKLKFVTRFLGAVVSGVGHSPLQLQLKKLTFYGKGGS
jgi:hypothetical protein